MNSNKRFLFLFFSLNVIFANAGAPGGPADTMYMNLDELDEQLPFDYPVKRDLYGVKGNGHHYSLLDNPKKAKWTDAVWMSVYRYEQELFNGQKIVAVQGFQTGISTVPAIAAKLTQQGQISQELNGQRTLAALQSRYKEQNKSCWSFFCCR